MPRSFRAFSFVLTVSLAGVTQIDDARADDTRVTIVDIAPRAASLDSALLRSLFTTELHMPAVAPDDPRAAGAIGTLTIDLNRETGDLAVTYLARDLPTTRHIALPKDEASARNAAVALGGNLARNEAQEIEATLRQSRAETLPPRAAPPATESLEPDAVYLRATLDHYAAEERHTRYALGGSLLAVGALGIGTAAYMGSQSSEGGAFTVGAFGVGAILTGGLSLIITTPFEDLAEYGHQDGVTGVVLEKRWGAMAAREHSARRTAGVLGLVIGGVTFGAGAFWLLDSKVTPDPKERNTLGGTFFALGAFDTVLAIYRLSTEGPIESSFSAYQESSGRTSSRPAALLRHVNVTPTAGGAMGVFSTTF